MKPTWLIIKCLYSINSKTIFSILQNMPPKGTKTCSCKSHDKYNAVNSEKITVSRIQGKKVRKGAITFLIENGDLAGHSTYLCSGCVRYAEEQLMDSEPPAEKKMVDITSYFDEFVKAIEHNKLHMDQLRLLAYTLGSRHIHWLRQKQWPVQKWWLSSEFQGSRYLKYIPYNSIVILLTLVYLSVLRWIEH